MQGGKTQALEPYIIHAEQTSALEGPGRGAQNILGSSKEAFFSLSIVYPRREACQPHPFSGVQSIDLCMKRAGARSSYKKIILP